MASLFQLKWLRWSSEPSHPSEDDLLRYLDGELLERRTTQVRGHLEACWACRALARRMQEAITRFAEFATGPLVERIPPAPQQWTSFAAALHKQTQHGTVLRCEQSPEPAPRSLRLLLSPVLVVLVLAVAAFLGSNLWTPTVSAAQLLEQAQAADARLVARPDVVQHRILRLDARRLPDGAPRPRGRVEVWQSGTRGIKARRYYDETGRLVAGEWRRAGGPRIVYRGGKPPKAEARPPLTASHVWLWDATAEDFRHLVGRVGDARVTQDRDSYSVSYAPPSGGDFVEARLVIAKSDLSVVSQSLVLGDDEGLIAFYLTETRREMPPADRVKASVFEPDPDLAQQPKVAVAVAAAPKPAVPPPPLDIEARTTLEIEAFHSLHLAGVQLSPAGATVATSDLGRLSVTVVVADETRKALLLRALAPLMQNPKVTVEVSTQQIDTRPPREGEPGTAAPGQPLIVRHLRRTSSGRIDAATLDRTARLYARWAVDQSAVRIRAADALREVAERWPGATLARLDLEPLAKWQSMIRDHVRGLSRDTEALRAQLEPMLLADLGGASKSHPPGRVIQDLSEVPAAVRALVEQVKQQHSLVRALFERAGPREVGEIELRALAQSFRELQETSDRFGGPWWLDR